MYPIFLTKKWIEVNDLSGSQCFSNKNIMFKTSMLRPDFCIIAMDILLWMTE